MSVTMQCPKCKPLMLYYIITTGAQSLGKWHVDKLPNSVDWPLTATLVPSFQCHADQHGAHRSPCSVHFSIINGEIVP